MTKTFDMQFIRYINLFGRVTRISPKHCFSYNNMLVFVVPKEAVSSAIGPDNVNLKKLSDILGKRIRVLAQPMGSKDLIPFIQTLVSPIQFEKLEVVENPNNPTKEAIITTAGRENKAMLIGRERAREAELKEILDQYFHIKNLRIL